MSFDVYEQSRTLGRPIELYFFRYGEPNNAYFAYTNAEQQTSHSWDPQLGVVNFTPEPIQRGEIQTAGALDKSTLEVKSRQDLPMAELFRLYPPSQVVVLTIFQGHAEDADFKVIWTGRVLGCSQEENEAMFICEPASTSLRRVGLRRNYMYGCPKVLFGPDCRASQEAATKNFVASAVAGPQVTLPAAWEPEANRARYLGGLAIWQTGDGRIERRTILRIDAGTKLILSGVASGLQAGQTISLTYGCRRNMDDCLGLHNNIKNYGGQPWIPLQNPIGIVNNYY